MSDDTTVASERASSGSSSSDHDSLANLLGRTDIGAVQKNEPVRDPAPEGTHANNTYDLTNPNLHHGTLSEVVYRIPIQEQFGSSSSYVAQPASTPTPVVSESFQLAVGDTGPTATAIANQSANEGQAFSLNVSSHFTAPAAGDTLTYSATLPAGLSINAQTGVISGTPTNSDYGTNSITVTATDAHGKAVSESFQLAVGDTGPTATAIANQSADEGQAFSLNVSSHFTAPAAGDALTYSATLPAGLSINAQTGVISGTPTNSDYGTNSITVTATDAHGKAVSESFQLAVGDTGPTATAIANQSANEGQAFSLNVSSHFTAPAAGDTLTYSATLPAGLSINAQTGVISGTPTDSDYGTNSITVTATDAHGKAVSESFQLAVGDTGPTATAIANQSANEGQAFSLNVSSHFTAPAAGDTLTYSATLPAGLSINAQTGVISGTPTNSDYGTNSITVTATDAHGKAVSESFQLAVGDTGPTATAIANQSANEGQAFSLNVSSHFTAPAAGDTLTYSATLPAGLSINAQTGVISGTPTNSDYGTNPITVTATDAHGKAVSESFQLAVGDTGPTATAIANQSADEGQAFSLNVSSHFTAPAAGDTLTYSATLPAGLSINAQTGVISGTPTNSDYGTNSITVTATDAHGKAVSESFQLAVGDTGPTATAIANQSANEGQAFSLNVSSHFTAPAAGDTLTYSATLPAGLSINAQTGVISGTPTDSDYGTNSITVTATDAHGKAVSESFQLAVGDTGPTATAIANQSADEGQAFSLNVSSHFTAPAAGDTLTYSATLPAGLSINAQTGVISGTPTNSDYGTNSITVTATDAHGKAVSESFQLAVGDTGPTATAIANQSADEGQAFSLNVSSHFTAPAAGDTLTYSATLPAGLSINAQTGVISGTPTNSDYGTNSITVTATDAHGKAVSESFQLAVGDTGPTATAIANQSADEGQAFSLNVSSHFTAPAAGDTLTYSATLPAGLSINAQTGVISGTPTNSDYGTNSITVTATDAHGKAVSESFQLAVGDTGPTATAIANQSANEGQAFSLNVSSHFTAPAAGDTLTYSATLPAGLSINAQTGVISGTPTNSDYGTNSITVTATDAHGKAVSESFQLAVGDTGPTATAIANQSANEGQAFSLNVSSHFTAPAAGDTLTYSATLPAGLSINAQTGVISGTPTNSDYGTNSITVTATDAHGKAVSESFQLAVGDTGPTATAIANQSANEGQAFSLNVSSHFTAPAAGDTLTYSATLPAGLSINAQTGVISGTPTNSDYGTNSITVTATDAHGKAVSESFQLAVGDTGPTATAIANQSANEGQAFSLNVSSHFTAPAAGDTLTYSATLPAGLSINAQTGVISGTPTNSDYGTNSITVTATDAHGKAVSESFQLAVGDTGPTATAIANQSANEGQAFSLNVSSHFTAPAAGDTLTYSATLPAGLSINAQTGVISGTPTNSDYGTNSITVTATDAHGKAVSESFQLAVGDTGPTATAIANQSANEGQAFSLNVSSHFTAPAAGDTLTYSATLPAGLSINAQTGVISGTPTNSDYGTNSITVTATDAHGKAVSESFQLAVGDTGPTATAIANQSANEGQAFSLNVSSHFTAPAAGDTLTYSATLPAGLSINAQTGVISGTPTNSDYGTNSITVTATDAHGKAVSESFQLAVGDTGPTATAIANQSANEGQAFSLNVSSHFTAPAAGDTLTYSATLPAGLSINAQTGVISGTPTNSDYGTNSITVTATDAHGKAVSESFQLAVGDTGPTATAIANQSANEGQAFSLNVSSHFTAPAAGDTLTYSATLPAGLSINAQTGVISGTPTNSDYGTNPITVTATDAHGKAVSESFQLAVGDTGPTATAIANQSANEGQAFSLNVSSHFTAPAAGDTLTYSATLPAGLSINAQTGVISGTPTNSDYGTNPITVTATDAHGKAVSESFQLAVGDTGPTATAIANQSADEGQAFSLNVSSHFTAPAAGDTLTYSATLPAGLSINAQTGIISGTPTDSDYGTNSITVTATDAHGKAVSESFQLAVGDTGPTATAIANQSADEGQAFSLNVSSHFTAPAAGDTLTYSATLPAGLSINAQTGVISGTPTDSDYGTNSITVTATDAHGMAVSESFQLAVGDTGPTATAIANQSADEGQAFSLDVSTHFTAPAAGDALTFAATLPAGLSINAQTGIISGTPTDSDYGTNPITVTATDAHGMAVSESFQLAVGDTGPTATAIANQSADEGQAFSLDVSTDFTAPAAGDALTFAATLPAGLSINAQTGIISGTPTDSDYGTNSITVTATDAHGMAVSESFQLAVGDTGPTATAIANQSADEGQAFSLDVSTDFTAPAAGDALTFAATLPAGLSINAQTGIISGTPTDSDYGTNSITVTATDAHGMAVSESFQLAVGDTGPTATAIANQSANEGQAFSLNVSSHFTAPAAGDTLTYSATLPAGLSINAQTGIISGTPTDSDYGTNNLYGFTFTGFDNTFTATGQLTVGTSLDAVGGYDVTGITGSVVGPNGGAISSLINNPDNPQEAISPDGVWEYDNVLYTGSNPLLDLGGILFTSNGYEYNLYYDNGNYILETLNPQDYLNGETGSFTITNIHPSQTITVTATDAHGMAVSETFQLAVGDTGPTATAIANQSADEGQAFSLNVSTYFTAPAAGDTLTYSATLPAGLSINAQTGVISGTPTNSDYGTNPITVTATDAHGMAVSESFQLAVGDTGPTDPPIPNQSANEGQPFTLDVATDFTAPAAGDTLTYSATLPAGLSINAQTGIISGTPTDSDYGTNSITVTATDAHGMAISETFQLAVGDTGPTATAIANHSADEGQAVHARRLQPLHRPGRRRCADLHRHTAGRAEHQRPNRHHLRNADQQRLRQQPDHRHRHRRPRPVDRRGFQSGGKR